MVASLMAVPAFAAPAGEPRPGGGPAAGASSARGCEGVDLMPVGRTRRTVRLAVICLVNVERRARGLHPLRDHPQLQSAAFSHSVDMRMREYFSHVGPGGGPTLVARLREAGYWPARAGENLAAGTGQLATPRETVEAWMQSRHHRANLLLPRWRDIGVGVVTEYPAPPQPGGTYTAVFGVRDAPTRRRRTISPRCPGQDLAPVGRTRRTVRLAVICLVNAHRRAHGRRALTDSPRLQSAAFAQSVDMRIREYFGHTGPTGTMLADRLDGAGFWPAAAGESLAQAIHGRATPRQIVGEWLRTPADRRNLLDRRWREIGVGVVTEHSAPPQPGGTYTLVMGRRTAKPRRLRLP